MEMSDEERKKRADFDASLPEYFVKKDGTHIIIYPSGEKEIVKPGDPRYREHLNW